MAQAERPGVLVITWNFPPKRGGMENLIVGLCEALRKRHSLFVITSFADSDEGSDDWVSRPGRPGLLAFSLHVLARGFLLLWRRPDIQMILGGSAMVTPLVLILAKSFRRKAVVTVHGLDLIYSRVLYQTLCIRWIKYCDGVVANSHFTASLARAKNARESSIHIIPPGISCDDHAPFEAAQVKKEMGLTGRKVLLYVGRLARRKGVKEFVQHCLPKIVTDLPETVFMIVGGNPSESLVHREEMLGEVKALVGELKLENYVRLAGWLSDADLARAYQAADLLVLPVLPLEEDVEGFGIVILEAAAAGIPCVASRVGGIPDAIEDAKSGVLVEPGDYEALGQTVVRLLRGDQARLALGRYAQTRVRAKFNWSSLVGRYETVFDELTAPHE